MTQLIEIRRQLAALRHRRRRIRWGTALAALTATIVGTLVVLFLLDIWFELIPQRVALWIVSLAMGGWLVRRFVRPFVGIRETETDTALLVEREHGIDSDLVAALQFERPEAAGWGSRELASRVVQQVAQTAGQIDVFRGQHYDQLRRRLYLCSVALVCALVLCNIYPRHILVFFQRWLLSTRHYPSATTVESLHINETQVLARDAVRLQPPEQAEGKKLDARSDVFSFGAVLYEMAAGQRAFHGDTPMSTLAAL